MALSFMKKSEPPRPATPQLVRSRFQEILDHLNAAYKYMDQASAAASTLVQDLDKGLHYIDRFRVDLTQSIEASGGPVKSQATIEEEIAAFIPKKVNVARPMVEDTAKAS